MIGFVGPRSLSALIFSQIARCTSFVGGGTQPRWQARRWVARMQGVTPTCERYFSSKRTVDLEMNECGAPTHR